MVQWTLTTSAPGQAARSNRQPRSGSCARLRWCDQPWIPDRAMQMVPIRLTLRRAASRIARSGCVGRPGKAGVASQAFLRCSSLPRPPADGARGLPPPQSGLPGEVAGNSERARERRWRFDLTHGFTSPSSSRFQANCSYAPSSSTTHIGSAAAGPGRRVPDRRARRLYSLTALQKGAALWDG